MILMSKSIIGLELDSQELRAVELKGSKKKPVVVAWGKVKLPDGIVKEGRVVNTELFGASLNRLLNENGFRGRDIFLGVNNQDVIVRFATFPKVPDDKIRSMIHFQAQDYIPVALEELELDYVVVSDKKTDEGEFINVVLVAARKKMLNDFIDAMKEARATIKEIDSTMLAIGRAALISSNIGTFALIGFNHDIGNILIFKNGILAMARTVVINQSPAWLAYQEESNKSAERESNVFAEILFGEIKSSVSYYKMQSGDVIDKLYIMGCNSKQDLICSRLAELTGLSVIVPSPYTFLEKNLPKNKTGSFNTSDYMASISLALRGLEE